MSTEKPKGLDTAEAIRVQNEKMPLTPAEKFALIEELLHPPIFDENDNIIGYHKGLITRDEAKRLLGL